MFLRRRREDESGVLRAEELAALADGSLAPECRARLEARVAASPDLAALLAEQEQAVALARSTAADVDAPRALRARIEAPRARRRLPAPRRLALTGAAVSTAVVAAVMFTVVRSAPPVERLQAALAPTGLVPGAGGTATLTRTTSGWRVNLEATGLPRLDGGRFYEAWLRDSVGVLVPIGTFNEGRRVTLWAGVTPKRFSTLTVTRERADGVQASSGEKVLVGAVTAGDSG